MLHKAQARRCVGCDRRIPWWWFSIGDNLGWWHILCIWRDELGRQRAERS